MYRSGRLANPSLDCAHTFLTGETAMRSRGMGNQVERQHLARISVLRFPAYGALLASSGGILIQSPRTEGPL